MLSACQASISSVNKLPGSRGAVWAARLLVLCVLLAVALLYQYAALHPLLGLAAVGVILVMLLVIARISAETGAFYIDPSWMPTVLFTALFGFDGLAPSTFIALALVSTVLIGNPREALAAYAVNALHLGQRVGRLPPGRSALGIGVVALVGFALAAAATLTVVYTRGLSPTDAWGVRWHPSLAFDALARRLADAEALGQLAATPTHRPQPPVGLACLARPGPRPRRRLRPRPPLPRPLAPPPRPLPRPRLRPGRPIRLVVPPRLVPPPGHRPPRRQPRLQTDPSPSPSASSPANSSPPSSGKPSASPTTSPPAKSRGAISSCPIDCQ